MSDQRMLERVGAAKTAASVLWRFPISIIVSYYDTIVKMCQQDFSVSHTKNLVDCWGDSCTVGPGWQYNCHPNETGKEHFILITCRFCRFRLR